MIIKSVHLNHFPEALGTDLEIEGGEGLLLLGDSGCGKTSLLKAIAGFSDLRSGSIECAACSFAILLQNPFHQIIMQKVKDELEFPLKNAGVPDTEIWARVQSIVDLFEINDLLPRDIASLSFGETQLVMIAATCLTPADVYLMDEPTSHLDPPKIQLFYKVIRHLCDLGKSVCISSQSIDEYRFVDRIILMEKGRVLADVAQKDANMLFHEKAMRCDTTMVQNILEGFSRS